MTEEELQRAAKDACNEYHRKWRRKNPDKVRARNRRYWERKALQAAENQTAAQEG
jgi:hypothetical protein